jgi:hypothetical protein
LVPSSWACINAPISARRHVQSVFLEMRVPLSDRNGSGSAALLVALANVGSAPMVQLAPLFSAVDTPLPPEEPPVVGTPPSGAGGDCVPDEEPELDPPELPDDDPELDPLELPEELPLELPDEEPELDPLEPPDDDPELDPLEPPEDDPELDPLEPPEEPDELELPGLAPASSPGLFMGDDEHARAAVAVQQTTRSRVRIRMGVSLRGGDPARWPPPLRQGARPRSLGDVSFGVLATVGVRLSET